MGFGAIAALAGTAISAGVGAASSAGAFGGGGPNLGEYSSTLNNLAQQYLTPFAGMNNQYWNLNIPQMAGTSIGFGLANAPGINQQNMAQLQTLLNAALPGYNDIVRQMTTNTRSLLSGQVPADVQQQIQRGTAYTTMMSGIGAGGPGAAETANAGTARALGLTSLDLTGRGETQASNLLQLSRNYLMPQPVNPLSLLPLSDLISGTEWQKQAEYEANYNAYAGEANAAAARVGAPSPNAVAGIGGALSGLNTSLQSPNFAGTGQTGYNLLGSLFGGGGGQTGSGIMDQFVGGLGLGGAGGAANFGY